VSVNAGVDDTAPSVNPTVDEVCVIVGPGYGECWGCPVKACVLWQDSTAPESESTRAVASAAAAKLASRSKVIQPMTGLAQVSPESATSLLAHAVSYPDVQARLRVQMATEAIMQDVCHAAIVKRQRQYTDRWAKALKGRSPTLQDDDALDDLMDKASADAAAEEYGCDPAAVLKQLLWFRGRLIVRRRRD